MSEHDTQVALFEWAGWAAKQTPELELLLAIPNGGLRNIVVAKKLKAAGLKPGVPDIFLPVARKRSHGLWIELKDGTNKPTPDQWRWIEALRKQRYLAVVCYSFDDAKNTLLAYLKP